MDEQSLMYVTCARVQEEDKIEENSACRCEGTVHGAVSVRTVLRVCGSRMNTARRCSKQQVQRSRRPLFHWDLLITLRNIISSTKILLSFRVNIDAKQFLVRLTNGCSLGMLKASQMKCQGQIPPSSSLHMKTMVDKQQ